LQKFNAYFTLSGVVEIETSCGAVPYITEGAIKEVIVEMLDEIGISTLDMHIANIVSQQVGTTSNILEFKPKRRGEV
jgi:hypothetical protein